MRSYQTGFAGRGNLAIAKAGHICYQQIHGYPSGQRYGLAGNFDFCNNAAIWLIQGAVIAVCIASCNGCQAGRGFGNKFAAIAGALAFFQLSNLHNIGIPPQSWQ